ncbi:protein DMR6-LIKE OXYGENASE 2-like [Benincasa hispida]|uniref:protein DMR6-LIKE OXYGENASE 2-like n=1 Tax=Benincasa hispida TaxID=102211 RepID=UPI0019024C7A|nr:protein DMR6-LIKE OXYGENASE 2-like [Benincasa hispida]
MASLEKMASVKSIAETPNLASIPSSYIFSGSPDDKTAPIAMDNDSIPTIDFVLLTSGTPDQRSKVVDELGKACRDWGFFMVINHGVAEKLREEMMECCEEFYDLTEEEKRVYETEHVLDPIRYGTSFNPHVEKVFLWRDYLKIMVHPNFHFPSKPLKFREISKEYCERVREMGRELMRGISESLGLERLDLERIVNWEECSQILIANLYPPCPQPELAMGLSPHSDHCLLTVLLQNQIDGLQILHDHKWVNVNPIPNSFLVNTADQLEILSNGEYKSVLHRAVVNEKSKRMSLAVAIGPSAQTLVAPAPQLLLTHPPLFKHIKYKDYLETMQSGKLHNKSTLDCVRLL